MPEPLIVAVLAGGEGRRMGGAAKPLLRRPDGRVLIEVILEAFASLGPPAVILATDARAPALTPFNTRIIRDPGAGPAAALLAAASALGSEWIGLAGGDQPSPQPEILTRLFAVAGPEAGAVAAIRRGRRQPLPALYRRAAVLALGRNETLAGSSLQAVLDRLHAVEVDADGWPSEVIRGFDDVNTPEQAAALGLTLPCAGSGGAG